MKDLTLLKGRSPWRYDIHTHVLKAFDHGLDPIATPFMGIVEQVANLSLKHVRAIYSAQYSHT